MPNVAVLTNHLVAAKGRDGGFYKTRLDDTLRGPGVKTVVVTGRQIHVSAQTTADGFFRGYKIEVPSDTAFEVIYPFGPVWSTPCVN